MLKIAFRKAVRENHPDLHPGDPDAPFRFRRTISAYAILRDAQQRATYDRLLEFERKQLRSRSERKQPRSKSRRIIASMRRNLVSDAIAIVCLTVLLVGGYTLFMRFSNPRVEAVTLVEVAAHAPHDNFAIELAAPTDTTNRDEQRETLAHGNVVGMAIVPSVAAAEAVSALGFADGRLAPSLSPRDAEIAKDADGFGGAGRAGVGPRDAEIAKDADGGPAPSFSPSDTEIAKNADGRPVPGSSPPDTEVAKNVDGGPAPSSYPPDTEIAKNADAGPAPSSYPPDTEIAKNADGALAPSSSPLDTEIAKNVDGGPVQGSSPPETEVAKNVDGGTVPSSSPPDTEIAKNADRGSAPGSYPRDVEIAKTIDTLGAPIDEAIAATVTKNHAIEPLDLNKAGAQVSALEKDAGVPKSSSSDFAISNEKHEVKIPGKPRTLPKRQATNRTPVTQVSLENRNASACGGLKSCSGDVPPLFGVGF